MRKLFILFGLFCFIGLECYSQNQIVTGKVICFKGFGVQGASVYAKKSKSTVHTDSLGQFVIEVREKETLRIRAAGFYPLNIKVKDSLNMPINLIYLNTGSAYQDILENNHLSKETLDYCIKNLIEENNNYDQMQNIYQIIQTEYPSAKVVEISGVTKVVLNARGPNSFQSGPEALLVVDGIVTEDIASVEPTQVKSVNVLVGNEAAHWGTRGGNGVIEITLKHGVK